MKLITIIGARPQFIKASTLSRSIVEANKVLDSRIDEKIIHTGQHYDANMSNIFFETLQIQKPEYYLGIGGGTHGQMTGRQIEKIESILIEEMPDFVIVYGDTNSTLAGTIAAAKLNIKIAHIEAGLRSFNRNMPEEINRVLTDHAADLLFTPTTAAVQNLTHEGISGDRIFDVGDVMLEATNFYKQFAEKPKEVLHEDRFILCTIHREENTSKSRYLKSIFEGLSRTKQKVILPLHPRTKQAIQLHNINPGSNIQIINPVSYLEMNWLEKNCDFIITDSGGVQKEAYFHQKFCITLREETEWTELVEAGCNILVGASRDKIIDAIDCEKPEICNLALYGDGRATKKIINALITGE